ncbi:cytochrome P450 [Pseudonocardia sp. DSM 110487]|uniref:cytochrome P450 n=1 Tax=Pseudonocardia sp. DSM 110487 TaxID=2865833 RepID=UPI001C69951C|nr:cytochrome P450 [Pseudonocardia sp. DSM 110487]QYN32298.1 cytochrome P450 [Pseudonocardia sp. DSM 110487]
MTTQLPQPDPATVPPLGRARLPVLGDVGGHAAGNSVFDLVPAFDELGSLVSRTTFGRRMLLAGRVDVVSDLCDDTRFAKFVGRGLQLARRVVGDGLFTAHNDEPNWAKAHDILVPAFTLDEIDTYHPAMLAVANELCGRWDAAAEDGSPVGVVGDLTALTLDTIGRAGFGYDFGSFRRTEPHPFVVSLQASLAHNQRLLRRLPGSDFLHRREDAAQERRAQHVQGLIDEVLQARRSSGDTSTDDLLGLMLNAVHPASGTPLDDANIRNQVLTFLVAGHETTSGALSFALQALVKNPAALARATAEVDALWGPEDDPQPGPQDVPRLRYVRQVLDETLRLWPTAPVFNRVSDTDTVIGGRFRVPAGRPVAVVVPALHRDPVWGPNVEAFDPDRVTPERAAARPPHAYKPFGTGERACIGSRFALHEATLVLGLLLHRFTLDDHTNYRLKINQALTVKPEGFTLRLRRRTPGDRATATTVPTAAASPTTTRRAPGTPLLVLHGSNLGSTRRWADTLAARAEDAGFTTTRGSLDDAADGLPTNRPVLVVAASYNGRPTDDAEKFVGKLDDAGTDAFVGVRYGVLGVGDRNWSATYQRIPTLIDDRLAAGGAQRLVERGEADGSIGLAAGAEPWIDGTLATLLDEFGEETTRAAPVAAGYRVRELAAPDLDTALHAGTLALTVEENRPLTDEGRPGRTKRLVRLTMPAGQRYRTGDQLVVRVANPDALVDRALAAFGLDGDRWVTVEHGRRDRTEGVPAGVPITVRRLLRETVELEDPARAAATRRMAELDPCPPEAAVLRSLADEATRPGLVELVERSPALRGRLDLATLLDLLEPLRPERIRSRPPRRPAPRRWTCSSRSSSTARPAASDAAASGPATSPRSGPVTRCAPPSSRAARCSGSTRTQRSRPSWSPRAAGSPPSAEWSPTGCRRRRTGRTSRR